MFSSLKALKCQSGGDEKRDGRPDQHLKVPSPVPDVAGSAKARPKLARRISRWKMESPVMESSPQKPADDGVRTLVTTVNVVREEGALGITLRGGMLSNHHLSRHVVITHIKPGGPAFREGTIKAGDRLLAVNGVSLCGSSLTEAQTILKQQTPVMALTIEYDVKTMRSELRRNGPLLVELERQQDEDLGLTLHQTTDGVFIADIKQATLAERCGALQEGDELLAVNGQRVDTDTPSVDEVARLLTDGPALLCLEILPVRCRPFGNSRIWSSKAGWAEECGSPTSGWYGSSTVTHSEKLHTMLLRDSNVGFGLELCDTAQGTVIAAVLPGSPAERSGCLYPGDRVLAVNHRSVALDMLSAQDACDIMESAPGGRLNLLTEFDVLDTVVPASGIFNVRLIKRGDSGLGLTITAVNEKEFAMYEVKRGSPAYRAGSLVPGDRLLAVNGTALDQCTAEHIALILQQPEQLITLKVERTEIAADCQADRKVTCTVELQRYGGPIGITIAGSEEPSQPITVSGLTAGGLAEQTGALLIGDEILAINEHSLVGEPLSTAHNLLQNSPDLVCLRISRSIAPHGRVANMSPLQPSSVDSAVESWASSHLDLTPSPDQPRPNADEKSCKQQCDWSNDESQESHHPSHLFDEITNKNLSIQRELEMLSQEIDQQNVSQQWTEAASTATESNQASTINTMRNRADSGSVLAGNGIETDYVHMRPLIEQAQVMTLSDRASVATADNFPITNLTGVGQWSYLTSSQPSLRSEFRSHTLLTVELNKDPVYDDFGFSVSDGLYERGVFINRIRKGGPADLSHCIYPYDRILQVNETCTQDFDCCLTVPLIASSGEKLSLLVARSAQPDHTRAYSEQNLQISSESNQMFSFLPASRSINKIVV